MYTTYVIVHPHILMVKHLQNDHNHEASSKTPLAAELQGSWDANGQIAPPLAKAFLTMRETKGVALEIYEKYMDLVIKQLGI